MKRNVIILTNGLAGSSVLTGLIAQAGYWTGETTAKKQDYDTYENEALVRLNRRLFEDVGYKGNYSMVYRREDISDIAERAVRLDLTPYREFIAVCNRHQPWIWKDPRLWLTIRFWKPLLDTDRVHFIALRREHLQTWISTTIRRQVQTYEFSRRYVEGIHQSILDFLKGEDLPFLELVYEDLLVWPERTLAQINMYLGTALTLDDLARVYRGPLYRKQRGLGDFLKATLIYLKNYRHRYR